MVIQGGPEQPKLSIVNVSQLGSSYFRLTRPAPYLNEQG